MPLGDPTPRSRFAPMVWAAAGLFLAAPGNAQAPSLQPPELIHFVEAPYPAEAAAEGLGGSVTLRLSIDAAGRVTDAEVVETSAPVFAEPATDAAMGFRFQPATRDGVPVPSRILYAYSFARPDESPSPTGAERPTVPQAREGAGLAADSEGAGGAAPVDASTTPERGPSATAGVAPTSTPVPGSSSPATDAPSPAMPAILEVRVRTRSAAELLRDSAEAVQVVETDRARGESADMGEVLARTEGVAVRRASGLGSATRFALQGLSGDQVRFFLDGIPLELAGYPFGLANVPVDLIQRVELYGGVVPIRFGADALGGAVNLVGRPLREGTHGSAAYQLGSFGLHRVALGASHLHRPSGFFVRASGYFDGARNDYLVDVETPTATGQLEPARVRRFHDGYRAGGANVEVGFVDRPWADRLILRAYGAAFHKQYQHNVVMTVPYGGVTYGERTAGGSLTWELAPRDDLELAVVAGYSFTRGRFQDTATCVYDWFGRCIRERLEAGETDSDPHDQLYWDHGAFGRAHLEWRPNGAHTLRLSVAPTFVTRTGDERLQSDPTARDPLAAERSVLTWVNGLEWGWENEHVENRLFVKQYAQRLRGDEPQYGGVVERRDRTTHRFGVGDGLRVQLTEGLRAKASYEWATRLPTPDEAFGDGAFVVPNLALDPEESHNGNVTLDGETDAGRFGQLTASVGGFARATSNLIVLLGDEQVQRYENVLSARALGVQSTLRWTAPGSYAVLEAGATYQDVRNASGDGTFGAFEGDRIPNQPYLFANLAARLQLRGLFTAKDELAPYWYGRYVHSYYRGWESIGLARFKQVIPAQLVHTLGVTYGVAREGRRLRVSLEVANLTDERVFDFFGVQRPGRSASAKVSAEF